MMTLHSFGSYVHCDRCGRLAKELWAESLEEVLMGHGICGACHESGTEAPELLAVRGIGATQASRLQTWGVTSLHDLASLGDGELEDLAEEMGGISVERLQEWRRRARGKLGIVSRDVELMRGVLTIADEEAPSPTAISVADAVVEEDDEQGE
jgi:hypothetical protein